MNSQPKRKSFPFNPPEPGVVMHFGFNANTNFHTETECSKWPQHKRKSEQQASASVLPPKMLITEERITQHFSGLQISGDAKGVVGNGNGLGNNNCASIVTGGLATDDIPSTSTGKTHHHPNPAYQMAAMELEQKLRNANRIVICDELKPGSVPGPLAPGVIPREWLIKSVPRPCTALVPWQPSPLQMPMPVPKLPPPPHPMNLLAPTLPVPGEELDDYDDDLEFFENNNTCNVNLNKSDEHMDEDL
ncbi:uncharacterized protein LOC117586599 [Drosophila guanche]|uniref:Uncharacterized protein n=1 Tax=Drosophila guanche TaxID=7266 RepID=A0A3B0K7I5_DROGU|nr:uncharacterized protein LOC117586599 [Drosophila guanche]XP_034132672.1 uncharacterized protein LOC117586599 [Drosophila guanche]SPP84020.1 Hypothetical predicted protein [Drosophila guanche]